MEQFLKNLNRQLFVLNRKERNRYIESYHEDICDKMEEGMSEEEVILRMGKEEEIAREILDSYEKGVGISFDCKYVNPIFYWADILVVLIAYIVSLVLCTFYEHGKSVFGVSTFLWGVVIIFIQLLVYVLFGMYSIGDVKKVRVIKILVSNIVGVVCVSILAYLVGDIMFSRIGLIFFGIIAFMGQTFFRKCNVRKKVTHEHYE